MKTSDIALIGVLGIGYLVYDWLGKNKIPTIPDVNLPDINLPDISVPDVSFVRDMIPQTNLYVQNRAGQLPKIYYSYTPPLTGALAPTKIEDMRSVYYEW